MTLSEEEYDANMKLSQLKNIMNRNYDYTAGCIEEILKTGYEINSVIESTPHLESKQPELIGCTALHLAFMENCMKGFEALIKAPASADYTIQNRNGLTVLHQILESFYRNESMLRIDSEFASLIMSHHYNNLANPCTSYGLSHFHAACLCNNSNLVKLFLDIGVSVDDAVKMDAPCFPGYTPLHFAVRSYGYETVKILLEKGANQNLENAEKKTPLLMLTEQKIKLMSSLDTTSMVPGSQLNVALDIHKRITHLLYSNHDSVNLSAFHLACTMEDPSLLKSILENDIDVNSAVDKNSHLWPGFTGLHFAALCNFENVISLLRKGANFEAKNAAGVSAFDMCLHSYKPENISTIISAVDIWKDIVLSDNRTTLIELLKVMNNSKEFEVFLNNSAGIISATIPTDSILWPGFTLLHVAVQLFIADIEIVNTCLKAGADVTAQSANGSSALHLAFRKGKEELVYKLLQDRSERLSNLTDDENLSVLHIACATSGHKDLVKNLLQSGIDVNVAYKGRHISSSFRSGFTALHVAVANGNHESTRLLLEHKADRYAADSDGFSPIHWVLASPNHDQVGAELFLSVDNVRESIVSGLSHLHVASYVNNYQTLDSHKFPKNHEFVKQLLAIPGRNIDVAVIYENSLPSFLSDLAGTTPFHLAVKKENWSVARQLALSDCDMLVRQPNGSVLLYDKLSTCAWYDGQELVTMLMSNQRAERQAREDLGLTMLHLACYTRDEEEIERSLTNGEDPNARIHPHSALWPGYTPLHILVRYQMHDYAILDKLSRKLKVDFDGTLSNADGDTAAHLAYKYKNGNYLSEFLHKRHPNYSVNPTNEVGLSYLHIACSTMDHSIVQKFLDAGAEVDRAIDPFYDGDSAAGRTPLQLALGPKRMYDNREGHLSSIVDVLLRRGAKVNAKDAVGETPLHKAVKLGKGKFHVLERVVGAGADVNALDAFGTSPWDLLLSGGDFSAEQLDLFIEKGCRLNGFNQVEDYGYVSLIFHDYCNDENDEANMLLCNAMLNHPQAIDTDEKGRTVVHSLVANSATSLSSDEYVKMIEQLLVLSDSECDIDDQDNEGRTALHVAAHYGNHCAIEGLLIAGADVNVIDNEGFSAFDYLDEEGVEVESIVIAGHVKKLEFLGIHASQRNRDLAARVFERLHFEEEAFREAVQAKFELAKNVEIPVGSYSLSLQNFLTETYSATTIHALMGDKTGKLIKQFFRDFRDDRLAELRSILKLQYRKALARTRLIERASDALDRLCRCTVLCARLVAGFLPNDELELVIEARMLIVD